MDLFICFTPLQTLIASRIISESNNEGGFLYYHAYYPSDKNKFYFLKLASNDKIVQSQFLSDEFNIAYLLKLKSIFKNKKFNRIFLASLDNQIAHYILSFCYFNELITFDDGSANINKKSLYYLNSNPKLLKKITHKLLGRKFYLDDVIKASKLHYTIFNGFENITSNVSYLNIYDAIQNSTPLQNRSCTVILGTVYREVFNSEVDSKVVQQKIISIMNDNVPCYYIPHPRENDDIPVKRYPDELLVFEDIMIDLVKKFDSINVFGFASSSQISILNLKNINCTVFYSDDLLESVKNLTGLLSGKGAKVLNLDKYKTGCVDNVFDK